MRRAAVPLGAAILALVVAGCSGSSGDGGTPGSNGTGAPTPGQSGSSGPVRSIDSVAGSRPGVPATGPHNATDVAFAGGLIPRHGGALTLAGLALGKATNPEVKNLARDVTNNQGVEIALVSGWLAGWGAPVPAASPARSGAKSTISQADVETLSKATGAEFDRLFVRDLITRNQDEVALAQAELTKGANPQAKRFAQSLASAQKQQISEMQSLLGRLGG